MFPLSNLHTHTSFSDGSAEPYVYIESALAEGMISLGFSDHAPLPFENSFALRESGLDSYCNTILNLKKQHHISGLSSDPGSGLTVFLGLEVDFIPGAGIPFSHFRKNYPVDYLIGSVHLVRNGSPNDLWFIDGPDPATYDQGLNDLFSGDIKKGVTAYYRQINDMLTSGHMEIIGHLDKIKMHNRGRLFSEEEPWYGALVDETLDLVHRNGVIVEVNTRGIYKNRSSTTFPGPAALKKINKLGIPVILSSDAHKPGELIRLFGETAVMLKETGFSETWMLTTGGWKPVPLD